MSKPLHITIGTAVQGNTSLANDIRLVKAAILYGDQATLCSLGSNMLINTMAFTEIGMDDRLKFLVSIAPTIDPNTDMAGLHNMVETYRFLSRKKRNRQELLMCKQLERALSQSFDEMREVVFQMAESAGVGEVLDAINSGLLVLQPFERFDDTEALMHEFFTAVTESIGNMDTYPLFDEQVGGLVRASIREGLVATGGAGKERAKVVGLAAGLIEQLPLFDFATVAEVIEIRRELAKPLVRFRSAIIEMSESVERTAWDADFAHDVEMVLRRDIEPAVLDIREALETNKYLKHLANGVLHKPLVVLPSSVLGLLVSQLGAVSHEASVALGIAAGAGVIALDAFEEWKAKQEAIESNRLFFYYKAGDRLAAG